MKSEKGAIEIFLIGIAIITSVILFGLLGIAIKEEIDYGTKEGQVVDKKYHSAYTTIMHSGKVTIPQYHPESYRVQIQKEINGKIKSIWVTVDKDAYHNINIGDYYNKKDKEE